MMIIHTLIFSVSVRGKLPEIRLYRGSYFYHFRYGVISPGIQRRLDFFIRFQACHHLLSGNFHYTADRPTTGISQAITYMTPFLGLGVTKYNPVSPFPKKVSFLTGPMGILSRIAYARNCSSPTSLGMFPTLAPRESVFWG